MEAMDKSVPLLERLKFIAIYSSNLDEFFRVRVANIRNLERINKKKINEQIDVDPSSLLKKIQKEVNQQLSEYGATFEAIIKDLKKNNLHICTTLDEIPEAFNTDLLHYFKTKVAGYLRIIEVDKKQDLFLNNQAIYLAIRFKNGESVIINIPSDVIGRFYKGKHGETTYYVFLDDVIRKHLDIIFPNREVVECYTVKLNKDADLQIDDEFEGNLVRKIEKQILKRNTGAPIKVFV